MNLLTRKEAAAKLRVSLRTFERNVQPDIYIVRNGRNIFIEEEELERWVVEKREGSLTRRLTETASQRSERPSPKERSGRRSESLGVLTDEAKAKLNRLRPKSTRNSQRAA